MLRAGNLLAQQATLAADAYVSSTHRTTNYGALSNLYVGSGATSLLLFDLGWLPPATTASQVARATLRVYVNRVNAVGTVNVQPVTSAWTESGVTYATSPVLSAVVETASVSREGQYVTVDVTALVKQWVVAPSGNFGLALAAGSADVVFDSKENDETAHPATLDITLVNSGPTGPKGDTGAVGAMGLQGLMGVAGPQGQQGLPGPAGVQGITGPKGDKGDKGDPGANGAAGANFRGAYDSSINYAVNDVVTWSNAAWISVTASNRGNTPSFSPGQWAILVPAAVGETGATGATGSQGEQGPQGNRGFTGDTGPQGATGVTGATGRPGFVYRGPYASATNYAAGDVVLWEGASWASLADSNNGNTPSLSPSFWGMLTSTGPQGPQGVAGATGAPGAQGPQGPIGPQGDRGLPGETGPSGEQGPRGIQGFPGAAGPAGQQGAKGDPGPIGLTFRGPYASATNFGLNDAVTWNGATWLSLADSNHGNTPDTSPDWWTLLAAPGATGASGATGAIGPPGPQGIQGPVGSTGDTGLQGPAGPQGEAGANYTGPYQSSKNYALHDVVTYNGSAYISVIPGNMGNTPGASGVTQWELLSSKGDTGPTGAAGPVGGVGPQGPAGTTGPQGTKGDRGDPGPQGPEGATGAIGAAGLSGPKGDTGLTGATGPAGLVWRGGYSSGINYTLGDAVSYNGASYVSTVVSNTGNTPGFDGVTQWVLLAAKGDAGATGASGASGTNGANGTNGAAATVQIGTVTSGTIPSVTNAGTSNAAVLNFTLPQGATGAQGLTYRGTWNAATGYVTNDAVYWSGSTYIALSPSVSTNPANDIAGSGGHWALLAQQGAAGPATVQIGSVSSGAAAAVTNSGTQSAAILNFTLPSGPTGAQGAVGLTYRGEWLGGTMYTATDAVTWNGSAYIALTSSTNVPPPSTGSSSYWALLASKGDQGPAGSTGAAGPAGPSGANGTAATITVGTVSTGTASVTNSGTSTAAVLNFTLPSGGGSSGGAVFSTIHTVTSANVYYSPMADLKATSEANVAIGYLSAACNIATVSFYNAASSDATVEIHTGASPSSMSLPASLTSCSVKGSKVTSCTGPGALAANSFMDFKISPGASGTSFVWSSFSCQ